MPAEKLDLNTCTLQQLCASGPGLTKTIATRILTARRRKQGYVSIDEVLQIRGVTQDIFNELRNKCYIPAVHTDTLTEISAKRSTSSRSVLVVQQDSEHWITPVDEARENVEGGSVSERSSSSRASVQDEPTSSTNTRSASKRNRSALNFKGPESQDEEPQTRSTRDNRSTSNETRNKRTKVTITRSTPRRQCTSNKTSQKRTKVTKPTSKAKTGPKRQTRAANSQTSPKTRKRQSTSLKKSKTPRQLNHKLPKGNKRSGTAKSTPSKRTKKTKSGMGTNPQTTTVVGGSTKEMTSAHLQNCFVAVHSTLKSKLSPIVTVDINPTGPLTEPEQHEAIRRIRGESPVEETRAVYGRLSMRSKERKSATKTTAPPLSVNESLNELLVSSNRDETRAKSGCRGSSVRRRRCAAASGRSHASDSERVSQWLEENCKYGLSRKRNLKDATGSARYSQDCLSPLQSQGNGCQRTLESDFVETIHKRHRHPKHNRVVPESEVCSCSLCKRCGKLRIPKPKYRTPKMYDISTCRQYVAPEPNMWTSCTLF